MAKNAEASYFAAEGGYTRVAIERLRKGITKSYDVLSMLLAEPLGLSGRSIAALRCVGASWRTAKAGHGRDVSAWWHGDLDVFWRARNDLRRKIRDVNSLGFILIACRNNLAT